MRTNRQAIRRRRSGDNGHWLSFSDLMSSLLLIFVLIMFYIMYQYFDMYEISMAEIARQQYDLDQANADLDEQKTKLTEAESQMLAQQIRLNAAQSELTDAEAILATQQEALNTAQSLLDEKETEIASQKEALDALSIQLGMQQVQINTQQEKLNAQAATLNDQETKLNDQEAKLTLQATQLDEQAETLNQQALLMAVQQMTLDQQQQQIEQLVGMKTRIIESLSNALRAANISAQVDPANGSIALESDVLFSTGRFVLTPAGQQFVDEFLPVYLNVLFSDEYREYVSEIIIEGHTDSTGEYLRNLELSQQRALAVASYVLADSYTAISPTQKALLRSVVTANGRSFSDPVLDIFGNEDMDASRRVVFKFRLTDEQMIQQLKSILESQGE